MNFQPKQSTFQRSPSPSPQEVNIKQQVIAQPPQNYTIPSKESYYFRQCSHPIEEICNVTQHLTLIPEELRTNMLQFICKEGMKGPGVYGEFTGPPNIQTIKIINGNGGYFLKKTTLEANIYLIWYHRERGVYMFWGPTQKTVHNAKNRIRGRIAKYVLPTRTTNLSLTNKMVHYQIADSPPPIPSSPPSSPSSSPPPLQHTMSYKHGHGEELPTYIPSQQEIQKNYQDSLNQKH